MYLWEMATRFYQLWERLVAVSGGGVLLDIVIIFLHSWDCVHTPVYPWHSETHCLMLPSM